MPKEFYTERDIEDMVKRGVMSLEINDSVVLTDLAYEKAKKLGMRLVRDKPDTPPGAPVRPYIAQQQPQGSARVEPRREFSPGSPVTLPSQQSAMMGAQVVQQPKPDGADLHQRIRSAVMARLGTQVDPNLLDVIINRVLQNTGIK